MPAHRAHSKIQKQELSLDLPTGLGKNSKEVINHHKKSLHIPFNFKV